MLNDDARCIASFRLIFTGVMNRYRDLQYFFCRNPHEIKMHDLQFVRVVVNITDNDFLSASVSDLDLQDTGIKRFLFSSMH